MKAINKFLQPSRRGDLLSLDFVGFQHFLLQYANFHWGGSSQRAYGLIEKIFN